ncbi:MAG TPA: diphosphate--fructose-6-phosphate 1-phosphotransferase [Candidatus Baltobacteraceae bacterium]|nr:diphosphate--fructose-6-phosphate 1-phosphotransferase [Candidatus Baltobacteraceae bacterium]
MSDTLAILVGGGPAPGINGVIASATIEAINAGLRVIGIYDGYRDLVDGSPVKTTVMTIDDATRIQGSGGSFLRTSRTNPAKDAASLDRTVHSLDVLGVRYLICIGGDDTTFGAARIAEHTKGRIGVATVPKTIDNDLPLPDNAPTFGFETARSVGAQIIESLLEDARTTVRWYIVVSMGRKSGALALGMANAAGATLAVIPEEFPGGTLDLESVVDLLAGAIVKRRAQGRDYGVAVVAEGIVERVSADTLKALENVARDAYGHVRLADVPIGALLRDRVRERLTRLGIEATVLTKDIGYELRCAKPVAFDIDYTRTLGYGAVRYLLGGGSGALIALSGGRVQPVSLESLLDPATGRIRTRLVDVHAEAFAVARDYMVRLDKRDLEPPHVAQLAAQTNLDERAFAEQFGRASIPM